MAPSSQNARVVPAFGGAIETRILTDETPAQHRAFAFEVSFYSHLWPASVGSQKPPLHFHPFQEEYIQVLQGQLCVEDDQHGARILTPADGEICIKPWVQHRLYPPIRPGTEGADPVTTPIRFILAGQDTAEVFRLDLIFFENWYAYQDETVAKGRGMSLVQVMSMFDAGGSYLSLPQWVPFNRTLAVVLGIIIGRWIGGMLGYQPFYKHWTSDWSLACKKMAQSVFQRRFADRAHVE
ncbi:hypothetical protein PHISCL_00571 [Aspergillus sclerotialis]|uniref:Cupin 2 conserved barrel domain-containing protein n=1 Tax=Aspergillus sclerotialis TaxID=2070753 RepID=A0A3A3A5X7_9EURO|nr:hypothetical protein PHISCL_00571 [Aspergillus sclerotialis]